MLRVTHGWIFRRRYKFLGDEYPANSILEYGYDVLGDGYKLIVFSLHYGSLSDFFNRRISEAYCYLAFGLYNKPFNSRDQWAEMPLLGCSGKKQKHKKAKTDLVTVLLRMAVGLVVWFGMVEDIHSSLYLSVHLKCLVRADISLPPTCSAARTGGVFKNGEGDFLTMSSGD